MLITPAINIIKIIELKDYIVIRYYSMLYERICYKICDKEYNTICSYYDFRSMYYELLLFRTLDNIFE